MNRPPNFVPHEIAVANVLLGSSRFLTLWLPPDWDLAPGVGQPEIVASHQRRNRKWVASGKAWYVIYNGEQQWAMELYIEVTSLRKKLPRGERLEPLHVQGHEAQVRWWERGRGFFRRRRITYMDVTYNCPLSERFVRVELSGRCGEEGFRALLETIPFWACH